MKGLGFSNLSALVMLGFAAWLFIDEIKFRRKNCLGTKLADIYRKRSLWDLFGPVKWSEYEHFLNPLGVHLQATRHFRHLVEHPDFTEKTLWRLEYFQLKGLTKHKPIKVKNAYIQSLVVGHTHERIPIKIDDREIAEGFVIPSHTHFTVRAHFPGENASEQEEFNGNGISIYSFRRRFSHFRFVFDIEGYKSRPQDFEPEEIDAYLYRMTVGNWGPPEERDKYA